MRCETVAVALALLLAAATACSPPPSEEEGASTVRLALVRDAFIFKVIQLVELRVLKASTGGGAIACSDLKGSKYKPDDPRFEEVAKPAPVSLAAHSPTKEIVIGPFDVPAGQPLVFVAHGFGQSASGPFAVGRGCEDSLSFKPGSTGSVKIDLTATTGADCTEVADCEVGLSCQRSSGELTPFLGGYCAKAGCGGDQDCPPGSRCISDAANAGLCLAGCEIPADCTWEPGQAVKDCVGRTGPTTKGCGLTCVYPGWSASSKCTP